MAPLVGGVAGTARVLGDPGEAHRLRPGDVLVARITTPAWTPLLFARVAAVVTAAAAWPRTPR